MLSLLLAAAVAFTPDPKDPRQRQLAAMAEELERAHKSLQLRGHEAPHFLSYAVRGIDTQELGAKYGAVFIDRRRRDKGLQVDVRVSVDHEEREFASTEGTRLVTERVIYALHVQAWARAPDGMLLENSRDFYGAKESELPRGEELARRIEVMVAELLALRQAPVLDPYTGPAFSSSPQGRCPGRS